MTNEEQLAVARGDAADALLNSEPFLSTITDLDQKYYKSWLMTMPGDTEDREYLWSKAKALQDLVSELAIRIATRDQLQARVELSLEDDD
jgi:hypothetical protein